MMRPLDSDAQCEIDVEAALSDYNQASIALARLLQRGTNLTDIDRLSIENNLAVVQLNYSVWIRQMHR